MTVGLLATKIFEMLAYMMVGFVVAKAKLVGPSAKETLSTLILYVLNPPLIIVTMQSQASGTTLLVELGIGVLASIIVTIIFILLSDALGKILKLDVVEKNSIIYTNCGNLLMPIIISILGVSAGVYAMPYIIVFNLAVWTHCIISFKGKDAVNIKKIILNPNIIAIVIGIFLFVSGVRLPVFVMSVCFGLSTMLGPVAMLMTGFVMAEISVVDLKKYKKLPLVVLLRLVVFPLVILLIFMATGILKSQTWLVPMFMVFFLAVCAPCANIVTQFAVISDKDAKYASAICVVSTIFCIATMPPLLYLFQALC